MKDSYDQPLSTTVAAAANAYNRALKAFAGFDADLPEHAQAALQADPGFVAAHCLWGYFMMLAYSRATVPAAAEALRAAKRHLKRGVLLYGPPGTGKTHTVSWLAAELRDATVIVLAGGSLGAAGPVARLARELAPSLVVFEDVDLVAEERTMMHGGGPILFELLNELDGMADDADVLVVLTTNRPDLLEPALAARPGRVDLAVEIPLPDDDSRRRLFELYSRGLDLQVNDPDAVVSRTAGVAASFFRELLRQATLEAAGDSSVEIRDEHVGRALDRLLERSSAMTKILLGATRGELASGPVLPRPQAWLAHGDAITFGNVSDD